MLKAAHSTEIELKSFNNEDQPTINIQEKLNQLSALTQAEYNKKFICAYNNYMRHRPSVVEFNGAFWGLGCMMEKTGTRPYIYYMEQRMKAKNLYETNKELLLLLNEAGMGKNKTSLNFHVLVEMFDLDYKTYDDKSATKLVEDTLKILRPKYPEIEPEIGPRMEIRLMR